MSTVDSGVDVVHRYALRIDEVLARRSVFLLDLVPGRVAVSVRNEEPSFDLFRWPKVRHVCPQSRREIAFDLVDDPATIVNEIFARFQSGDCSGAGFVFQEAEVFPTCRARSFRKLRKRRE